MKQNGLIRIIPIPSIENIINYLTTGHRLPNPECSFYRHSTSSFPLLSSTILTNAGTDLLDSAANTIFNSLPNISKYTVTTTDMLVAAAGGLVLGGPIGAAAAASTMVIDKFYFSDPVLTHTFLYSYLMSSETQELAQKYPEYNIPLYVSNFLFSAALTKFGGNIISSAKSWKSLENDIIRLKNLLILPKRIKDKEQHSPKDQEQLSQDLESLLAIKSPDDVKYLLTHPFTYNLGKLAAFEVVKVLIISLLGKYVQDSSFLRSMMTEMLSINKQQPEEVIFPAIKIGALLITKKIAEKIVSYASYSTLVKLEHTLTNELEGTYQFFESLRTDKNWVCIYPFKQDAFCKIFYIRITHVSDQLQEIIFLKMFNIKNSLIILRIMEQYVHEFIISAFTSRLGECTNKIESSYNNKIEILRNITSNFDAYKDTQQIEKLLNQEREYTAQNIIADIDNNKYITIRDALVDINKYLFHILTFFMAGEGLEMKVINKIELFFNSNKVFTTIEMEIKNNIPYADTIRENLETFSKICHNSIFPGHDIEITPSSDDIITIHACQVSGNINEKERSFSMISDIKFELGKIYAVVGGYGTGKSTLLKAVVAQADYPFIIKAKISMPDDMEILRISQEFRGAGPISILEFLLSGIQNKTKPLEYYETEIKKYCKILNFTNLSILTEKGSDCHASGGEKTMLEYIRARMTIQETEPKKSLLIIDEPFSNIDGPSKKAMQEDIKTLIEHFDIAVVIVDHDNSKVENIDLDFYNGGSCEIVYQPVDEPVLLGEV